jgi:TetR/AcrR family acrAB operon transcriptional repressor
LLDAALVVFSLKGYASTTLNDIADEAGVTRGAIYWHFGSKAELYSALVQERFAEAMQGIEIPMDKGPLETMRELLIASMRLVESDPRYRAVLELTMFKTEVSPELEQGLAQKSESVRGMLANIERLIESAKAGGEVRSDVNPHTAALGALGMTSGLVSLWLQDPTLFNLTGMAEHVVGLYVRGLQ